MLLLKGSWHNVALVSGAHHGDGTSLYLYALLPPSTATICYHSCCKTTDYTPCAVCVIFVTYLFHNWKPVLLTPLHLVYPPHPTLISFQGLLPLTLFPMPTSTLGFFVHFLPPSNCFQSEFADHLLVLVILLQVESHVGPEVFWFFFFPFKKLWISLMFQIKYCKGNSYNLLIFFSFVTILLLSWCLQDFKKFFNLNF